MVPLHEERAANNRVVRGSQSAIPFPFGCIEQIVLPPEALSTPLHFTRHSFRGRFLATDKQSFMLKSKGQLTLQVDVLLVELGLPCRFWKNSVIV